MMFKRQYCLVSNLEEFYIRQNEAIGQLDTILLCERKSRREI